jgi:hypothetical protein
MTGPPADRGVDGDDALRLGCGSGGVADHQSGLEGHLGVGAAVLAVLEQHVDRGPAGRRGRRGHRGQPGPDQPAQRDVVDADHADVLRDTHAQPEQAVDQPDRHQVVVREHRTRATAVHVAGRGRAGVFGGRVGPVHGQRDAATARGGRGGPADLPVGPRAARPGQQDDALVAEPDQVSDGGPGTLPDVHHHRRQSGHHPVDHNQRHVPAELVDQPVAHPRAAQQHAVDLPGDRLHQLLLHHRVLVGVGHEEVVVALARVAFRCLDQWWEEWVGDVGDDQSEIVCTAGDERPRGPVRPIPHRLRDGQHPAAGLRVDHAGSGERAGNRRRVHSRGLRHVADRRRHAGPPGKRLQNGDES